MNPCPDEGGREVGEERPASEGGPYNGRRNPRTDLKIGHYRRKGKG